MKIINVKLSKDIKQLHIIPISDVHIGDKQANLKMFKEYYGILSITSIVPCIIAFGLSWFITSTGGIVYLASTTIYGLIMLYAVSFLNLNKK